MAVLPELPTQDFDVILGNDLAVERMGSKPPSPILQTHPTTSLDLEQLENELPQIFPLCAVTRAMARRGGDEENSHTQAPNLNDNSLVLHNDFDLTKLFAE